MIEYVKKFGWLTRLWVRIFGVQYTGVDFCPGQDYTTTTHARLYKGKLYIMDVKTYGGKNEKKIVS